MVRRHETNDEGSQIIVQVAMSLSFCLGPKIDCFAIGNRCDEMAAKIIKHQKSTVRRRWLQFKNVRRFERNFNEASIFFNHAAVSGLKVLQEKSSSSKKKRQRRVLKMSSFSSVNSNPKIVVDVLPRIAT
uniref:Uncharacterized protein n=1 Tax=Romanomermis culicivorax TaxID=13658 RepID=A0A915HIN6_ROMCU